MLDLQNFPLTLKILDNAWESRAGGALRGLLWSLHNQYWIINLWSAMEDLNLAERAEFVQLLLMGHDDRERVLRAILSETGEMKRIETCPTRDEYRQLGRTEGGAL